MCSTEAQRQNGRGENTDMQIDNDRIRILQQTQLFADFAKGEIPALLRMLRAKEARYSKGSFVLREGARRVPSAIVGGGPQCDVGRAVQATQRGRAGISQKSFSSEAAANVKTL